MNSIYALEHFNNYFNRKVKHYNTLDEYLRNSDKYEPLSGVNFNPADGVNTTYILNAMDISPDYLLVVDDLNHIVSRWFITDAVRTRNGQHRLSLTRDVIAEHYTEVIDAPCLVDRAMVDVKNPLLYNTEGDNTFNQIKQSEHLLKDETGTNWIVGYIARDTNVPDKIISITESGKQNYTPIEALNLTLKDEKNPAAGATFAVAKKLTIDTTFQDENRNWYYDCKGEISGADLKDVTYTNTSGFLIFRNNYYAEVPRDLKNSDVERVWSRVFNMSASSISMQFKNTYLANNQLDLISSADVSEIQALNGRIVYSMTTQKYYQMRFAGGIMKHIDLALPDSAAPSATEAINSVARGVVKAFNRNFSIIGTPVATKLDYTEYPVTLQEIAMEGAIETSISNSRQHLIDAPFDMFAIPYSTDNYNLAQQINLKLGNNLYDLQLLPYCPVRKMVTESGVNLALGKKDSDYSEILTSQAPQKAVSYILWASKSSDNFRIRFRITTPVNNLDLKVYSETTFVRLVSPNYNGVFEFNAAKNSGVDYFEVSYTYKPYSPYIHVNPNFKGLYGTDFNDARGLQCGGDFSVSMTSDAWRQYEINNKNYQNIFNTEIKTMDANQELQNWSNGIASAVNAVGTGLMAGFMAGPIAGGVAGAVSGAAGIADMYIQNQMYQNNRQAKVDMFKLNLGNIKARPDSLTKVSAHTITNKYFPFVEIYSATSEEKKIFKDKLTYFGMNIRALGKISDFVNVPNFSYFKGTLIRLDAIKDDAHIVNQIAQELNGGLYF